MSKPSRILVCGGREYADKATVEYTLNEARRYWFADQFCIIQGGARGADALAKEWAVHRGVCCIQIDANWGFYGPKAAGTIRNGFMLQFGLPHMVIAFPGGNGTANMIKQARLIPNLAVIEAEV